MAQSNEKLSEQMQSKRPKCMVDLRQSNLMPATQEAAAVIKGGDYKGEFLAKPFLDICHSILRVLDKLGSPMAVIRADVGGNIQRPNFLVRRPDCLSSTFFESHGPNRLEDVCFKGKTDYKLLFDIVREEAAANIAKKPLSCTKAIIWLTRSLDFTLVLFRNLLDHPEWTMNKAVEETYNETLKPWHGWISAAAFKVCLKLVPERQIFLDVVAGEDPSTLNEDLERFISTFSPILEEIHNFLKSLKLNRLKSC